MSNSKKIVSNQSAPHDNLADIVKKHLRTEFRRPVAPHNARSFSSLLAKIDQRRIIFDGGCGNGKSTLTIAQEHPNALIVGIDKSAARLAKLNRIESPTNNTLFIRADLIDFYRLAASHNVKLEKHYILYPNPWPKKQHILRRWHGSPIFPSMLSLGGELEVRSNWRIYLEEMAIALQIAGITAHIAPLKINNGCYFTDFEEKYHRSGHSLYRLTTKPD